MMVDLIPSNSLDYITIQGFKSIASIEKLPLRPINVVIGANGSGKSNFIGVFDFLHTISYGGLRNYVTAAGGAEKVLHFGSKTTKEIELQFSIHEDDQYELTLFRTGDDGLFPSEEVIYPWSEEGNPAIGIGLSSRDQGREAGVSQAADGRHAQVRTRLRSWRLHHLSDTSSSSPMRSTSRVDDNRFFDMTGRICQRFSTSCERGIRTRTA